MQVTESLDYFHLHLTMGRLSILALVVFVIAYLFVMTEEFTQLRKSKPMVLAAGIIWVIVAWYCSTTGQSADVERAIRHNLTEFGELFLFLLVAMTYVNAMEERSVFEALRAYLVRCGFTYRQLYWVTGILAFCLSPIADNLTTALVVCSVTMALGKGNPKFVTLSCINIVVAANAGGAFCPFGDITTLMVWQKKHVQFYDFFHLFIPSLVSFLIPALCMHFAIPNDRPTPSNEVVTMKLGARRIILLFIFTLISTVLLHNYLNLPPFLGMMTGLGCLMIFSYSLQKHGFDIFSKIKQIEWDTLFFFYGVMLSVGGLATLGYLELASKTLYQDWGMTYANISVGFLSAIVDNIPIIFAVLTMNPDMSLGQWLLITLTAGIGGSLLSVGSAAGVALMGQAQGLYTFMKHLKWTLAILLGYIAAILAHFWINSAAF